MPIREMLLETFVHMPPRGALDGLTAGQAVRSPAEGLHSVAAILAHMAFWQAWCLDRCDGTAVPMASAAAVGWPEVSPEGWSAGRAIRGGTGTRVSNGRGSVSSSPSGDAGH